MLRITSFCCEVVHTEDSVRGDLVPAYGRASVQERRGEAVGLVAKRRDSRYRSGRCRDWIKVKNIAHSAIERAMLIALSKRAATRLIEG